MRSNSLNATVKTAIFAVCILLLTAGISFGQVNLTAGSASVTLPDGTVVPMWGYTCGTVTGSATCAPLNLSGGWSPVLITVPTGQDLQITLANSLPSPVPTSLVIVGQLGGGLGDATQRTTSPSPLHDNQPTTWPIANTGAINTPPAQGPRVQSFSTEVATGGSTTLTWKSPRPGTYLLESGTHPSIQATMGLYGILVVTTAPTGTTTPGTAYPGVSYNAEVPLLFSEIDPAQNNAVIAAVGTTGFSETATRGTYLNGPMANIGVTNPGSGYLSAPNVTITGGGGTGGGVAHAVVDTTSGSPTYGQVTEIDIDTPGSYISAPTIALDPPVNPGCTAHPATAVCTTATAISALQLSPNGIAQCSGGAAACYPPTVNYTPLYYLINGVAFDKNNAQASLFSAQPGSTTAPVTGTVLVRMVNAGSRMHVPSIVGAQTGTGNAGGFSLIAEDGNPLPGIPRVQSEVFMPAGKTYDVMVNVPASATALPIFDRELSLSANAIARDAGMLAYVSVNSSGVPADPALTGAVARDDSYNLVSGQTLSVADPSKGLIANDTNVNGVQLLSGGTLGTLTLNANGTFTYIPNSGTTNDTFTYCANGSVTGGVCSSHVTATVTLGACTGTCLEAGSGIAMGNASFNASTATYINIAPPGVLASDKDGAGYPLTVATGTASALSPAGTLWIQPNGGFIASVPGAGTYTFSYNAQNSQGTKSASQATVTLVFPTANGPVISVLDGKTHTPISDYRWVIEEDRTFYVDPNCTTNPPPAGCPTFASGIVPTFGTNFHTSYMPVVATGCTGTQSCEGGQTVQGKAAVCDVGNGICRFDSPQQVEVDPRNVALDPTKRYYISVLPGDAANPFITGNLSACPPSTDPGYDPTQCGHGMGGAPIAPACRPVPPSTTCTGSFAPVTILSEPSPYPPSKLSVFVFEDDFPLNGEQDASGGIDTLATNEPGLGGFNITLFDDAGGTGDATGQMTYDMFNQPLSNSLSGTIDPATGEDACPIAKNPRSASDVTSTGITGTIVTCPKFEADGVTASPLAGQAVVANLMPGRYGVVATPGADRIARGEEWLQTNTLDGQKAHDSFLRIGEPNFFQEFGPASYHVTIGFASPAIINGRKAGVCNGTDANVTGVNCTHTVTGKVTTERMSRTPDERLYSSGSNDSFSFTQCYVSLGDTDGEDFAFTKCNSDGTFTLTGIPDGNWRITVFDQWNDMLVDGLSTPVGLGPGYGLCTGPGSSASNCNMGDIAMNQWQANIYTSTFFDQNGSGVMTDYSGTQCTAPGVPSGCNPNFGNPQPGLTFVATNIRFRDGSYSNFNNTDLSGNAGFNEVFPLFSWYVVETDTTRFKSTGIHVVYDAGGAADGTPGGGHSNIGQFMANTQEIVPVPSNLRVPGAVYCDNADCTGQSLATGPITGGPSGPGGSTGRIDPPWVQMEGWQGFSGQNSFLEFGKKPFAVGETGGIHGEVIYASTRPFDDPSLLIHTSWTPDVPGVTINLYKEGTAPDGTTSLSLIDTTKTSSWDDWAQGFRSDGIPNMNCPGQGAASGPAADLFFFTLYNQPMWLDFYQSQHDSTHTVTPLPSNAQFKCYDGMHNWNQLQPAPYDGYYAFPSVTSMDPVSGKPTGTNCTGCVSNPDATDKYRFGTPMLPAGKYVVEMIVPPGYELVKEEDKNILIGDNYIAPVTVEFPNLAGSVYILPDQAEVSSLYNPNNPQNPTQTFGRTTYASHEGDTGSIETFWPCVGQSRIVPDFISLYPGSQEVAPFAGATRNLCDRKEITLDDQSSALAKFWIFTSAHVAAHFTGVITDDFTSEFDPFSPQFGEKFSPANMPIALKDWSGQEISRVYTDQWGTYDGLTYSTWEVNPPNPTGYAPTMMVVCMNDPGTGATPDALFNPQYSQFCYEIPFMPGQTQYMDTPVVPTSGFAGAGYNNPDCNYPDATPAIREVDGDGVGPWVSATGHKLTIKSLGDVPVPNYGYSGPSASTSPFNQKTTVRHYGFGATQGTGTVTIGGKAATVTGWSDTQITVTVPSTVPACSMQQQAQYGGVASKCGELVITTGAGKQSVDAVTVTVENKSPTHVTANDSIQGAINAAAPGDLIIVDPGVHQELVIMWKPVRLQGVGAASSIINANTQPAGKLDVWRAEVNCLFGLALNGQPYSSSTAPVPPATSPNVYDPTGAQSCPATGWNYFGGGPNNPQVDRLPLEGIVGWDTTVNGNLAQLLQEPSLMGAYEGAGITVLAKGVRYANGLVFGNGADSGSVATEGQFPLGTVLLSNGNADCNTTSGGKTGYSSNFQCNPSRIDGLSITDASQGGGGIFLHAWAHNMEIANNRVYNNTGTLTGGITIGQGESPDALVNGNNGDPVGFDQQPWTCYQGAITYPAGYPGNPAVQNVSIPGLASGAQLPYCYDTNVNVHNNAVIYNSSIGDEVFSGTPAGAGGVTFSIGADGYKFQYNWVCGNLSSGDGGGFAHMGYIYNGDIEHNAVLFNQSTNPTIATNGGGIVIMGAAPDGTVQNGAHECGSITDVDCAPGLSDGTGPGLVINANLIMGNGAESGSGGGLRLQDVNGTEVAAFPLEPNAITRAGTQYLGWNSVLVTNNIIANNVAGWDGGGVSLQDALNVDFINNTVMSNDTTASSGVLFNTLGAPLASAPGDGNQTTSTTTSAPQAAGLVSMANTSLLQGALSSENVFCPAGHATGSTTTGVLNGDCKKFSVPRLYNDVFWQNRSFYIGVGALGSGTLNQQNVVTLYNSFTTSAAGSQPSADATVGNGGGTIISGGTGACVTPNSAPNYWDLGVRGDSGPTNHASGLKLAPIYSVYSIGDYAGSHNSNSNPTVLSQYCNGSRVPPENGGLGYQVPPGIADATVPNPIFSLTPAATVDEGNNWINISWGPLSLTNPVTNMVLGNYGPAAGSSVISLIPSSANGATGAYTLAPSSDFYGTLRKTNSAVDAGAVEFIVAPNTPMGFVTGGPLSFGNQNVGTTSAAQTLTLHSSGTANLTNLVITVSAPFAQSGGSCSAASNLAPGATCTINVTFSPTAPGAVNGTVTITANGAVSDEPVQLTGTGISHTATVTPSPLAFGNEVIGSPNILNLTVTNTGNGALAGGSFTGLSAPFTRVTTGAFPAGAPNCVAALAVGASCTIKVQFSPTAAGLVTRTLTVAYTGATVTGSPVTVTGTGIAGIAVSPASLAFGTIPPGTTSASQTLTVHNATGIPRTLTGITVTAPFSRPAGAAGGSCNTTTAIGNGGNCTIIVVFAPPASTTQGTAFNGSVTVTTNVAVTNSPVTLTGTAETILSATLTPSNWSPSQTRNCPGTGLGVIACLADPAQVFTLTNTGNVNLTGVTAGSLAGDNTADYAIVNSPILGFPSNCGDASHMTLAPGATCSVSVQFRPQTSEPAGTKNATVSVTDSAGTQSSTLTGAAN